MVVKLKKSLKIAGKGLSEPKKNLSFTQNAQNFLGALIEHKLSLPLTDMLNENGLAFNLDEK